MATKPDPRVAPLLWGAVLAPAAELLPALLAGGRGGWLVPLAALPLLLAGLWAAGRLAGEEGLAAALARRRGGRLLLIIYMVWGGLLLALRLGLCARRLMAAGYRDGSMAFFLLGAAALILFLGMEELPALARTGRIFLWALGLTGGAVLLLALPRVEITRLFPLWSEEVLPLLSGALPAAGALGWGFYGAFLLRGRPGMKWVTGGCVVLTGALALLLGALGPGLTMQLEDPFFALAKTVGLEGAFQRGESLAAAVWTLADLAMGAVLLFAQRELWGQLRPGREKAAARWVLALAAAGGLVLFSGGGGEFWSRQVVPAGNLAVGLALPLLLAAISCGDKTTENGRCCEPQKTAKKLKKSRKKC